MPFSIDEEIAKELAPVMEQMAAVLPRQAGDWETLRALLDGLFTHAGTLFPPINGIDIERYTVQTADDSELVLSWFTKVGQQPGSAALYIHGGGYISGSVEHYAPAIRRYVADSGVPILAVDYRLAPEHQYPTPVEDCYAALKWLTANAKRLGVEPSRIAVMGDSAGGGLAVGTAALVRDRGELELAAQILIYPMLSSRTTISDPNIAPFLTWTHDDNVDAWKAFLGEEAHPYFTFPDSPNPVDLPPAYIEVGELDGFRDECVEYGQRLRRHAISAEVIVRQGCPHAFELIAPDADVSLRAFADRSRRLAAL
ncbi:alpha/beta hydrolase [Mycobacterium montefiorense]|uniref:alpha/beta hydrolase n=1 Tax=Mycobacterium montefiorense TaxID=154654 RepID=UPI0021F2AE49|nr:alpha/beta hydrolase [Mycobacterium montefiorense]MCV7426977.1 alpha/beta hydrolase [Mycobacterium montefiorense]